MDAERAAWPLLDSSATGGIHAGQYRRADRCWRSRRHHRRYSTRTWGDDRWPRPRRARRHIAGYHSDGVPPEWRTGRAERHSRGYFRSDRRPWGVSTLWSPEWQVLRRRAPDAQVGIFFSGIVNLDADPDL